MPLWLRSSGPVFLLRLIRNSKSDPLVEEVDILHCNERYAIIRKKNGLEDTVSLRDLAPIPSDTAGSPHGNLSDADYTPTDAPRVSPSDVDTIAGCLLYTSPSPRDLSTSRMPSSA